MRRGRCGKLPSWTPRWAREGEIDLDVAGPEDTAGPEDVVALEDVVGLADADMVGPDEADLDVEAALEGGS